MSESFSRGQTSRNAQDAVGLVLLITLGVGLRLAFQHLPNFAPVAAIAMFAGYYFRSWKVALLAPLAVMGFTDLFIGGYDWRLMLVVYTMLALPVALRGPLRRWFVFRKGPLRQLAAPFTGLVVCGLASSVLFFLATNLGTWAWSGFYPRTLAGLVQCYAAAVPFFRYTLVGDLVFCGAFFGMYAVAANRGWCRAVQTDLAAE